MKKTALIALLLVLLVVLGSTPSLAASPSPHIMKNNAWMKKIDKRLLSDEAYNPATRLPFLKEDSALKINQFKDNVAKEVFNPVKGKARVMILYKGGSSVLSFIKQHSTVYSGFTDNNGGILLAWVTKDQVKELALNPNVLSISLQNSISVDPPRSWDTPLNNPQLPASENGVGYIQYGAPQVTGAEYAWSHGYNGTGVKVAVVDTGIDMGESDLGLQALARDNYGLPLLFDADQMGFALTLNPGEPVNDTAIRVKPLTFETEEGNISGVLYFDPWDGGFYLTNESLVLVVDFNTWSFGLSMINVSNMTFTVPSSIDLNQTDVYFGLISENIYVGNIFIWILAPSIIADTNADGYYDSVYIDLSTTYYMLMDALNQTGLASSPNSSLLDYSFADEPQITYGNEIAARDFNGDGVNDLSLGALSQAFNDAYGVLAGASDLGWLNDAEYSGYILPGIDSFYGQWFDLVFDFHGHGTNCAHIIASRGQVARPTRGPFGSPAMLHIKGIAPGAKVGGAPGLWMGDVVIAQLYLSGWDLYDPETFTWVYTGDHKVDVISNSWGNSYLLLTGFASDADVVSLFETFIAMTTGTVIVHAAGNGGPGFGSVTIPGAAAGVITVGASTLFYYRPIYNYMPGAYGQVVSWSDRGPTEFGYPKPDVVNIGSFEYSVGRVIDGLGDGLYNVELFGGTSEATPMTAGAVAVIIQALRDNGLYNFTTPMEQVSFVKAVLKSSASDLGYDPFSQGSGHVNLTKAIEMIESGKGVLAYSHDSMANMAKLVDETMSAITGLDTSTIDALYQHTADTALYYGVVKPGSSKTMTLSLSSFSNASKNVKIEPVYLKRVRKLPLWLFIDSRKSTIYIPGEGFVPFGKPYAWKSRGGLYVDLSKLPPGSRLLLAINPILAKYIKGDNLKIVISYPYNVMDPEGRNGYYDSVFMMGAEYSYWVDWDGDNHVEPYETGRMQYDIRVGNTLQIQMGYPLAAYQKTREEILNFLSGYGIDASQAIHAPVVDLRVFQNGYYGGQQDIVKINGVMETYNFIRWPWISVSPTVSVPGEVQVKAVIPRSARPGVYEGYLRITDGDTVSLVPISVAVPAVLGFGQVTLGPSTQYTYYDNYQYTGALDQSWRPEVGDWRTFPILIDNRLNRVGAIEVSVKWSNPTSSFDVGVIGSGFNFLASAFYGGIPEWIDASVLAGKISIYYGWSSAVYGYFDYPSPTEARVIAPVGPVALDNYNGNYLLYWIVVHQVFSDNGFDKPVVTVKSIRQLTSNIVRMHPGGTVSRNHFFYTADMGSTWIDPESVIVVPMSGSTGSINVSIEQRPLSTTRVMWIKSHITASEDAHGTFLVLIPIYGEEPSVLWGFIEGGEYELMYYQPSIAYVTLVVHVG